MRIRFWKKWPPWVHPRGDRPIELGGVVLEQIDIDVFLFFLFEVLEELALPPFINDVVNHARSELHGDQFEQEAEDLSEEGVPCENGSTVLVVLRELQGVKVPTEHDQGSHEVAWNQGSDLEWLVRDRLDVLFVLWVRLSPFPLQLVVNVQPDIPLDRHHDQQEPTEQSPASQSAVIPQVELCIHHSTTFSKWKYEPGQDIYYFECIYSVFNFLQHSVIFNPINFAHDMKNVDCYPDKEVSYRC